MNPRQEVTREEHLAPSRSVELSKSVVLPSSSNLALNDGYLTDPESDSDQAVEVFNSFAVLDQVVDEPDGDVMEGLQIKSGLRSVTPLSSPRNKGKAQRHFRRLSVDNGQLAEPTLQELKDFQSQLPHRFSSSSIVVDDCPRSALIDEKDIELLNKLVKKKAVVPESLAKYSLRSNDVKSKSFSCLEYSWGISKGFLTVCRGYLSLKQCPFLSSSG